MEGDSCDISILETSVLVISCAPQAPVCRWGVYGEQQKLAGLPGTLPASQRTGAAPDGHPGG